MDFVDLAVLVEVVLEFLGLLKGILELSELFFIKFFGLELLLHALFGGFLFALAVHEE